MSITITDNAQYSKILVDNVNKSIGHNVDYVDVGLEYDQELICLNDSQVSKLSSVEPAKILYEAECISTAKCTITRKPLEESIAAIKKIQNDLFAGSFYVEIFDTKINKFILRKLEYTDIIISGSCMFTVFYDLVNTATGSKFVSNDIDTYLMINARAIQFNEKKTILNKVCYEFEIGTSKYQFIRQNAAIKTNVYGFYDFDICRGCFEFLNDNIVKVTKSKQMLNSISSGYCVLGLHTTTLRIAKYSDRGLGILKIKGTKVIDPTEYYNQTSSRPYTVNGLNAVRAIYCDCCKKVSRNDGTFVNIQFVRCKECLSGMGIEIVHKKYDECISNPEYKDSEILTPGPTFEHTFVLKPSVKPEDRKFLVDRARTVRSVEECYKIKLQTVNLSSLQPTTRGEIMKKLGIKAERLFTSGFYFMRSRKHRLSLSNTDPLLIGVYILIKLYEKDIIYKTSFKNVNENMVLDISLYIPKRATDATTEIIIDAVTKTTGVVCMTKPITPVFSGRRYKSFSKADLVPENQLVKIQKDDNINLRDISYEVINESIDMENASRVNSLKALKSIIE